MIFGDYNYRGRDISDPYIKIFFQKISATTEFVDFFAIHMIKIFYRISCISYPCKYLHWIIGSSKAENEDNHTRGRWGGWSLHYYYEVREFFLDKNTLLSLAHFYLNIFVDSHRFIFLIYIYITIKNIVSHELMSNIILFSFFLIFALIQGTCSKCTRHLYYIYKACAILSMWIYLSVFYFFCFLYH